MKWLRRLLRKKRDYSVLGKLFLLECKIHGSHYYDCLVLVKQGKLCVGEPVILRREPDNEYDKNAIEVLTRNNMKLGYLPKKDNVVIAALIDQKCEMFSYVENITTTAWEPVTIRITMNCKH
ncbi:MAG: HIRAN domain-containing protein [Gammaproteobacteria bacterium]|nr:HIRAN domain-containing protein [Gammaproteobacteria bacterium]